MEELCTEGLVTHGDPESCVDDPRGRGEALAGARAGRAIEPRNQILQGADAVQEAEGNIVGGASASRRGTLRGHGNQGMCGTFMRENREIWCPPVRLISGRAVQGTPRR
jgi:hypothetical protein